VTGNDGLIRLAKIHTSTGRTNRPISRLYPLEVSCEEDLEQTGQHATDQCVDVRPTRAAALKAYAKLTDWVNILRGPREDVKD